MLPTLSARAGALITAIVLGLTGLGVGLAPTSGAAVKNCGDIEPVHYGIKADGVSCAKAKKVVRKWEGKAVNSPYVDSPVSVAGFRCKWDYETSKVSCKDGGKSVKWTALLI